MAEISVEKEMVDKVPVYFFITFCAIGVSESVCTQIKRERYMAITVRYELRSGISFNLSFEQRQLPEYGCHIFVIYSNRICD